MPDTVPHWYVELYMHQQKGHRAIHPAGTGHSAIHPAGKGKRPKEQKLPRQRAQGP